MTPLHQKNQDGSLKSILDSASQVVKAEVFLRHDVAIEEKDAAMVIPQEIVAQMQEYHRQSDAMEQNALKMKLKGFRL